MIKKLIHIKEIGFLVMLFLCSFFFMKCGMRGIPSGGPEDVTPPQIKKSSPENFSTNFTGTKIEIKFDEYIQIKSFKKNFLISPPVAQTPKYRISGKILALSFDTAFNENTTYSMFLGEAVVDLNESNILDSNLFVFSTGKFIDSLTLEGTIKDAKTGVAEDELLVHLYRNLSDTAPLSALPTYFAVVKEGKFKFTNLAAGSYRIFALKDGNSNYLYDLPDEKIAFSIQPVSVPWDSLKIELNTFSPKPEEQKIFKPSSGYAGEILLTFNKAANKNYQYSFLDSIVPRDSIIEQWNNSYDSLTLYSPIFKAKNRYLLTVSTDTIVRDSLKVKIGKKAIAFKVTPNYSAGIANNFYKPLKFSFNKPLASYCDSCLFLVLDSVKTQITGSVFDSTNNQLTFNYQFQENKDYKIIMDSAAFTSLIGESTDSLTYDFPTSKAKELGNLILSYEFPWGTHYILEVIQNEKAVHEIVIDQNKGTLDLLGLSPGKYQLKITIDSNADGQWSPGSYVQQTQSERVEIYPETITVRANWDIEIAWNAQNK